jgi:hypothetical protein
VRPRTYRRGLEVPLESGSTPTFGAGCGVSPQVPDGWAADCRMERGKPPPQASEEHPASVC